MSVQLSNDQVMKWWPSSLSMLTPYELKLELTHLTSETSIYITQVPTFLAPKFIFFVFTSSFFL